MAQTDPGYGSSVRPRRWGPGRRGWRRILWWGGLAMLAGVLVFLQEVEEGLGWPFWMIGPVVVSTARVIVGAATWVACFWLWARGPHTHLKQWWLRVFRAATVMIIVVVTAVLVVLDGVTVLLEGSYAVQPIHVLKPTSPGGCRLVLWREPDFGDGQDTYGFVKVPGSARLRKVPGVVWLNLDNSSVRWRLTWTGGRAHLTVWSTDHPSQTWNGLATPVVCPAR